MNGVIEEIAFQNAANIQAPHIAALDPERISGVCQESFNSHGASWYCAREASFSFGAVQVYTSKPSPTPPKTNRKIDLKPTSAQRISRSMTESQGASGFTQTVTGSPRACSLLRWFPRSVW